MRRRDFLFSSLAAALATRVALSETLPLKFGHRQANMGITVPGPAVFELASRIPGLSGVELQMFWKGQDLSDHSTALGYKREANRWGCEVPSIAGVWKRGASIFEAAAEETLSRAINTAELLGASVILVSQFKPNCPDMNDESSYGPVVRLYQKVAQRAADAGVTLGLETSLTPADDMKLIGLIDRPSVGVYFDATNVEMSHPGLSVPGIELLGSRIIQCHLKNDNRLLDQQPSKVGWMAAFKAFRRIQYNGWYVFETAHSSPDQCVEATKKNIQFVKQSLA